RRWSRSERSLQHPERLHRDVAAAGQQLHLRHGVPGAQVQAQQDATCPMAAGDTAAGHGLPRLRGPRFPHDDCQGRHARAQWFHLGVLRPRAVARPARHRRLHLVDLPDRPDGALRHRHPGQAGRIAAGAVLALSGHRMDRDFHDRLPWWTGMIDQTHDTESAAARQRGWRREFRSYAWGVGLALVLTLVPFALVNWGVMARKALFITIGAFALVQMIVHFRFFLHIGFHQKREDLQLILFSTLLLFLMVAGTIWIMASLAGRMAVPMHMPPAYP